MNIHISHTVLFLVDLISFSFSNPFIVSFFTNYPPQYFQLPPGWFFRSL